MIAYLKNLKKYNNIKIAKGILLDDIETKERTGSLGISTKKYGENWYMLPKGRAIFKSYRTNLSEDDASIVNTNFYDNISKMRIVNELICQELCKQVNVLCAEYELATKGNDQGLVSYDVAKPTEKLINGYVFLSILGDRRSNALFADYMSALQKYKELGYEIDIDKTFKTLYKMALFDCLTAQADRHKGNVFFLLDEENKKIRVAPLIDNELAFNIENIDFMLGSKDNINKFDFLENLDKIQSMLTVNIINNGNLFLLNLKDIVKLAIENKECKKILINTVKNFNLSKAIEKVKALGVEISPDYEKYLLMCEKEIKKLLKQELENQLENKANYTNDEREY